jgi:hypothetical protein
MGDDAKSMEAQQRRIKKKAIRMPSKPVPSGSPLNRDVITDVFG